MYYEVYIDQMFLENVLILVLLLRLCGKWMCKAVSWKRIWLSSVLGAAASCAVIFFQMNRPWIVKIIGFLLPLAISVILGLGCRRWRDIFSGTLLLLGTAAVFGGFLELLFSVWEPPVLLAAAMAYTAIDILIRNRRRQLALGEFRAQVVLEDQGSRCELTGLVDTGNRLTEPLTGRPVSILERQTAEKLPCFVQIRKGKGGCLYIPYHAVGTTKGRMMGIVIDAMWIRFRGESIRVKRPILAISGEKLNTRGEYQMIVNPICLQEKQT